MTERRSLSPTAKLKVFERHHGVCHICERKIQVGEKWDAEHVIPLALGGADDDSNLKPAHKDCHSEKTRSDNASWSKAKRTAAKHRGIRKRSSFACSRDSRFKKKLSGEVVLR